MNLLKGLRSLIVTAFNRSHFEEALADEIRHHIEENTNDLIRAGMTRAEAERRSRLEFGGVETIKEECRQARGLRWLDELAQDFRYGARLMAKKAAFPAEEYLVARLEMDDETSRNVTSVPTESFPQHYATIVRELEQRIAIEPQIIDVTLAERLPLMPQDGGVLELDEGPESSIRKEHFVTKATVDLDFFQTFQAPALAGRVFTSQDLGSSANAVVVNRLFVDQIMSGRNVIGRRIRYKLKDSQPTMEPSPWLEIVGVVRDLVPDPQAPLSLDNPAKPLVYHVLGSAQAQKYPLYVAMHVKGEPQSVLPTLRRLAADVSPTLRLTDIQQLDEATRSDARAWTALAGTIVLVSALALLLSLAGIYSVTSFAVSRRTREIAVRVALGAPVSRVITTVFAKPLGQVAAGVTVGCTFVGALVALSLRDSDIGVGTVMRHAGVLFAYGAAMMAVCAVACVGPILRVFRVEPTDVLRDDQ